MEEEATESGKPETGLLAALETRSIPVASNTSGAASGRIEEGIQVRRLRIGAL
jgi:hypothetical protein